MGRRMTSVSISTVRKIIKIIEGGCNGECIKCEFRMNDECINLKKYDEIRKVIRKNYGGINE